jgi:single-strand DNA-binding protein
MLNITAHGNLGNDPEVKYLESGNQVANFSLAVRTGKDETTWLNCAVWGKRAQTAAEYLRKGAKITIIGQGKLRSYTTQDGTEKQSLDVNVTDFTLPARESNAMEASNDDIPF